MAQAHDPHHTRRPADGEHPALGAMVERLMRDRYPVSAANWLEGTPVQWWPRWDAAGFAAEWQRWRDLAEATARAGTPAWVPVGRYARWAARRIAAEAWRAPWAPLAHARGVLAFALARGGIGEPIDGVGLLADLGRWLRRISPSGGDLFARARLALEARELAGQIARFSGTRQAEGQRVKAEALNAIRRYVARSAHQPPGPSPLPWMGEESVDGAAFWVRRRRLEEATVSGWEGRVQAGQAWPGRRVLVPELGQGAWFLPTRAVVVHGPKATWSVAWAEAWGRAFAARPEGPVWAWLLEDPEAVPAQAWAVLIQDAGASSTWPTQVWEAIAVADWWLWLDRGEPETVAAWLARWLGPAAARGAVVRLRTEPGRWVRRAQLAWTPPGPPRALG
ncbi:MAG: hypothetical protein K6U14_05895 [Firmicutes bacterium]|nr:hypothetical protein [Alicyclobacillaceae bacterium]MCL6497152.1 hypothetical protein [Bacillota bacterium]